MAIPLLPVNIPPRRIERSPIEDAFRLGLSKLFVEAATAPFDKKKFQREDEARRRDRILTDELARERQQHQFDLEIERLKQAEDIQTQGMVDRRELVEVDDTFKSSVKENYGYPLTTVSFGGREYIPQRQHDVYTQGLRPIGGYESNVLERIEQLGGITVSAPERERIDTAHEYRTALEGAGVVADLTRAGATAAQARYGRQTVMNDLMRQVQGGIGDYTRTHSIVDPKTGERRSPTDQEAMALLLHPLLIGMPKEFISANPQSVYFYNMAEEILAGGQPQEYVRMNLAAVREMTEKLYDEERQVENQDQIDRDVAELETAVPHDGRGTLLRDEEGKVIEDINDQRTWMRRHQGASTAVFLANNHFPTAEEYVESVHNFRGPMLEPQVEGYLEAIWRSRYGADVDRPWLYDINEATKKINPNRPMSSFPRNDDGTGGVSNALMRSAGTSVTGLNPDGTFDLPTPGYEEDYDLVPGLTNWVYGTLKTYSGENFAEYERAARQYHLLKDEVDSFEEPEDMKRFFRSANHVRRTNNLPVTFSDEEIDELSGGVFNLVLGQLKEAIDLGNKRLGKEYDEYQKRQAELGSIPTQVP